MKKVEVEPDQVTIYLDQVSVAWGQEPDPMCQDMGILPHRGWWHLTLGLSPQLTKEEETFTFAARQDFLVRNLQPATVTLYDYYETGEPCRGHGPTAPPCTPVPQSGAGWTLGFTLMSFGLLTGMSWPEPVGHRPSRCR